ncbi:hypothetical protein TNCV_827271 [Trichonephila clavipes]|nr:hypothetical protein TNCV_827271 [Trichonephila clavipes]
MNDSSHQDIEYEVSGVTFCSPHLQVQFAEPPPAHVIGPIIPVRSYTRAFGDGPRNFEPWLSDVDDTLAGTPSPNYHTTPTGGRFSSRQVNCVSKAKEASNTYNLNPFARSQLPPTDICEANPQVYVETPLHPEKLTVWCALWAGGIIGPYFFKNDEGHNVTVNVDRYRAMITNFFIPELNNHDV